MTSEFVSAAVNRVTRTGQAEGRSDNRQGTTRPDGAWRVTRQQKRREETIDRLLDSARFILQRDGHATFTLRAVATHAGMRLSNLQHYFESKEHLLVETARHALDQALARHRGAGDDMVMDPRAAITRILDHTLAVMRDPVYAGLFLELWVLSRHSDDVRGILVNRFRDFFELMITLAQRINPDLDRASASAIAFIQIGMIEGTIIPAATLEGEALDIVAIRNLILRGWEAMWRTDR